ncbi:hypothetical protein HS7_20330 [Sulfolobales archaeon HS-7]|nr:hypothetical protein HS7_20330 [Sulfolobales archaeon HS-7]
MTSSTCIVDGKYVKLTHGEKGVFLVAVGVTSERRIILDVVLAREEDKKRYWDFLVTVSNI